MKKCIGNLTKYYDNSDDYISDNGIVGATYGETGIDLLDLDATIEHLCTKPVKTIPTHDLAAFIDTLGTNKTEGKNGLSRGQYFFNARLTERLLKALNPDLEYVNDDHNIFIRGSRGTDDPDFKFVVNNITYFLEVKENGSEDSYFGHLEKTNFHNAYVVISYLIFKKQFVYAFRNEGYSVLYTPEEAIAKMPALAKIKLPTKVPTIRFNVNPSLTTDQLPAEVTYTLYNF